MEKQPQAFLSYTRIDDEFFGGAITSLRRLLELGVQVVTGDRNFLIFQDVDGIEFGQKWQKELDRAIHEVKFLIPILTPCFLRSDACRDELKKFIDREKMTGRDDLILPIYFVTTPILEQPDLRQDDPLAVEMSSRQRYDWRSQADLPITDPQAKRAVRELAERISRAIARTQLPNERTLNIKGLGGREFEDASERAFDEIRSTQVSTVESLILWVDDRPENNAFERKALESYGAKFVLARSTEDALEEVEKLYRTARAHFDVIISDMGRPPDSRAGYTLLEFLRSRGNQTPFFIYAGSRAPDHVAEALGRGAQGTTNVPDELIEMVIRALKRPGE